MPGKAAKVQLSMKQQAVLEEFSRSRSVSQAVRQRATIVLRGFDKCKNQEIAEEVGLNRLQVGVWRRRWQDSWEALCLWECEEPKRLREAILEMLKDAPRPGAPSTYSAEQVAQILALACESPELSNRPIGCWTHRELRNEVVKRNIAPRISVAQVGRYLKESATQPHRHEMWLTTREKDQEKFEREAKRVCQTYLEAPAKSAAQGTHTVSVDEATSLQALERTTADKPTQQGSIAKREFEYKRHGTTTLTAGLDVVTGKIVSPTLEPTRTAPQFVDHLKRTIAADPGGEWVFVVDNLNTHASEDAVKWVAEECGVTEDLGKKKCAES